MGWKENGKFGITTGRTIRSPFASGYGKNPLQDSEVLLKFTRETDSLSSREFEEFLTENDIGDGLGDFTDSTTLRVSGQGLDRVCVKFLIPSKSENGGSCQRMPTSSWYPTMPRILVLM